MSTFFITTLAVCLIYNPCCALNLLERGAEFIEEDVIVRKNEFSSWKEVIQDQPVAILLESQAQLLESLKKILEDENNSDIEIGQTTLATFDSMGLHETSFYNDTADFRQAIIALKPTVQQKNGFSPAIHALTELLQGGLPQGSVLLVTTSKPSDEDFLDVLMKSLTENRSQLSVLWAGDEVLEDYFLLKDVAIKSGGKFEFLSNDNQSFPKSFSDNSYGNIKFPEEQNDSSAEDTPMVLRAADQRVLQRAVVPLIVEVASGTNLEAKPGTVTQIQYNVKNNINVAIPVSFFAKYNGIVQMVQPTQTVLQPSATATVVINLQPIGVTQNLNAVGTVTLFATAAQKVTARSAIISTTPHQLTTDTYAPKMTYKYEGDCLNYKEPQNCENGQWSLEATFHDEDSGLLKILSEPYGLVFQSEFIAGTKTPVTVYYSATCCQPNAHIWAEDLRGNYVKKSFDVFNQNLLTGEIASIVLGILLLLFIIIAVIVAVVLIRRRNQRNLIIPRARSGSR